MLEAVVSIVRKTGALDVARASARSEAARAIEAAKRLPDNAYSACLISLASQLLERNH
jgi:octaprenyl-diphosphate synthase